MAVMKIGLVGLGQSGRSSLFAALGGAPAAAGAAVAAGPAGKATLKPPLVNVKVPDARLEWLRQQYTPRKFTPASVEFLDLPGLRFNDSNAAGDNTQIIAFLRQIDCLVAVLRAFPGDDVPPYRGSVNAERDFAELTAEFALGDQQMVEKRIETLAKTVNKPTKTQEQDKRELALMQRCREALEAGKALSELIDNPEEVKAVRSFGFLTQKPILWVLNVGESELPTPKLSGTLASAAQAGTPIFALSAKVERDLAELGEAERAEFAASYGLTEPAKDRVIRGCYQAMGLISFLTAGEDEVRAWTLRKGESAVEAAGAIHSDLAVSFIKAETIGFDELKAAGSLKAARAVGKVRQEGKSYIVADGDVIEIKAGKAK